MSQRNLHELNIISQRNNNRKYGFPVFQNNSLFLKNILANKTSNNEKYLQENYKPKKIVNFKTLLNTPYKETNRYPIKVKKNPNYSLENFYKQNNNRNIYINTDFSNYNIIYKDNITPHIKNSNILFYNDSSEEYHHKVPRIDKNRIASTPNIYQQQHSLKMSNSNINDSENEIVVLRHKGRKIFNISNLIFNTPEKNLYHSIQKDGELYRNSEELKKKREEIYQRKMKRESSAIRREILRKKKDKELKEKKLDIDMKCIIKDISKNSNKQSSLIIKNNKFNLNKINNEIVQNNDNNKNIALNGNIANKKSRNEDSIQPNTIIKRINKYKINRNFNILHSKESNTDNIKDININKVNNNYNLVYKKKFKTNNIYLSKVAGAFSPNSIRNTYINKNNQENIDDLRKMRQIGSGKTSNSYNIIYNVFDQHNKTAYNFYKKRKRFIEDFAYNDRTIYSKDKKISIRVHILQNLNELFLGKKMTKEKLRLQRVINICITNNNKIKLYYSKNRGAPKKNKDFNNLSSIKEEEKIKIIPKISQKESETNKIDPKKNI